MGVVRVLIVEDSRVVADRVADGLRDRGMAVDVAYDGQSGLDKAVITSYDVVILDRDLPKVHGDSVCRQLVAIGTDARILMLTAAGAVSERVDGLNLGADDYLPKPFDFCELVARVESLGRRMPSSPPVLRRADLVVDRARRTANRGGNPVPLARKELAVLEVLLEADGGVVSAEDLLERVWDEHADPFTNAVSMTLARLRAKLGSPPVIETVIGSGYCIR
jgi:DNA-binding response OmpR family regulator